MKRRALGEIQVEHVKLPAKAGKTTKAEPDFEKKKKETSKSKPKKRVASPSKKQLTSPPEKHEVPALEQCMELEDNDEVLGYIQVLDIDDFDDPQLCCEYASSIYAYMMEVENGLTIRKDYLLG